MNKNTTYLNADYKKLISNSSKRMGSFPGSSVVKKKKKKEKKVHVPTQET